MEIFLTELVQMLDSENPFWRQDTVLVWDNASYHTAKSTKRLLEILEIPVM